MDNEPSGRLQIGSITSGIKKDSLPMKTIDFVRQRLSAWRDDPARCDEASEDKLNAQLCKFLDSRARTDFPMVRFNHEEDQYKSRQVDLSATPAVKTTIDARAYSIYDPFLVLECKRLPAPSSDRTREYVSGGINKKTGGIQRFKLGLHGAKLDLVAMIGYLQDGSVSGWHKKINKWIAQLCDGTEADCCTWADGEMLELLDHNQQLGIATCRSMHSRAGPLADGDVEIHHLWVLMNGARASN